MVCVPLGRMVEINMEHFYESIQGWCDGIETLYKLVAGNSRDGDHFVEIGCWRGKSSAFMAVELANSGKQVRFDCVDTWKGSEEHQEGGVNFDPAVLDDTLYNDFLANMKPVEGRFNPIRMSSVEAASLYEDNTLDFVFIDGAHDYDSVMADVAAWFPKVKSGGVIAGHDLPYPPVQRAVTMCFGNQFQDITGCWAASKQ